MLAGEFLKYSYICDYAHKYGKIALNFFYTKCVVNSGKLRVVAKIVRIQKFVKIALRNFAVFWWDSNQHPVSLVNEQSQMFCQVINNLIPSTFTCGCFAWY